MELLRDAGRLPDAPELAAQLGPVATLVGLLVAFGGPTLLVSPAGKWLGPQERMRTKLLEQGSLWLMFALVIAIVLLWEQRPLASIGVRPLHWSSFAWGAVLAVAMMRAVVPAAAWVMRAARLPGFDSGLDKVLALPVWFRLFAVLTAGVVEETLFRGYAVERLAELSGSYLVGGALALIVFALVHLPLWGPGPVLTFFISGGAMTAFYIWQQDLLACAIAHAAVDAVGLVIAPARMRTR